MNSIITRNGWLNGETKSQDYPEGMTLGEFADKHMPVTLRRYVCAQRNGEPLAEWENYIPRADEHILLYIVPQGGGDDKNPVISIVGIALAVAAPQLSPFIFGGGFIGAATYWVGASLVMNALTRALIKPPQQQKPIDFDRSSNPFLYFSGIGNRVEPWGNVPRIYGRMRYYPKLIVHPEQRTQGNAIYYYLAFDFGYGPLQLSNFKLGEVSIDNYTDVEQIIHHSFTKTSTLEYFESGSTSVAVNQELLDSGNIITMTTMLNSHRASISLVYPNGLYGISSYDGKKFQIGSDVRVEARLVDDPPNDWEPLDQFGPVRSTTMKIGFDSYSLPINLQKWFADGVWKVGIPQGTTSLRSDNVPPVMYGNQFAILSYQWIIDPTGKIPIKSKGRVVARNNITRTILVSWTGQEIVYSTYTAESQVPANLTTTVIFQEVGDTFGPRIYLSMPQITTTQITNDLVIDFEVPGQYEIRIWKAPPAYNPTNNYIINDVYVTNYISYSDYVKKAFLPEAPHTVVELKIKATAQLSGMIDNFNAIAESLLPIWNGVDWDVPVLDPVTNQWSVPPTRNPAWIYCDVLRGSANKRPVSDDLLDLDALLDWANANALPAPNDPDHPSFNCDLVISSETTVKETLQTIASVGRAAPARRDSKFSIIRHDESQAPVQLITPKNSSGFSATINYVTPPHALKVAFIDEDDGYSSSETIIYNDGYDSTNATIFEELNLPGSTRRNQVWRLGRYYMAAAQLQRERVKVTMDYEYLVCQRGDLVLVAHDVLKAGGLPRRVNEVIADVTGDTLILDEAVTATTAIRYRGSDDIIPVSQIGDNEIKLPPGQTPPNLGDLIEYGVSEEIRAPFIVEEITPGDNLSANVTLVEYRPEINDAVTSPIPPRTPRPGASGEYAIGAVTLLQASQNEYELDGARYSEASLTWLAPALGVPSYYVVYEMIDGIPFWIGMTEDNAYAAAKITNLSALESSENITFGVQAVIDRVGVGPIEQVTVTVSPDIEPPPDVTGFGCNAQTGTLFLFWDAFDAVQNEEVDHFEIRYTADELGGTWATASLINDRIPANATDTVVPLRPGIYFIKAVDAAGNYSVNAASTVVQIDDLEYVDEFLTLAFQPFDDGTYDRVNIDFPGQLRLNVDEIIGYYYPDPADFGITLAAQSKMRLYANVQGMVVAHDSTLDSPWFTPLANAIPLQTPLEVGSNAIDAQIDFRWKATPADAWSAWTRLYVADVTATLVEFRVMLRTKDLEYTPAVTSAGVRADWLERTETGSDLAIVSGGQRVTFINAFAETPVVAITMDNANAGDFYLLTNLDRTGFDIEIRQGDNSPKAGQIDYIARGYGKEY